MESRFDYLTCTIKPEHSDMTESESKHAYKMVMKYLDEVLLLKHLRSLMQYRGKVRYYDDCYVYNDIQLKLSAPSRFARQGMCLEMSGNGLLAFEEFLSLHGWTLKQWCSMFRSLCLDGIQTKFTRCDYAMDDKQYDNAPAVISMRRIIKAIVNNEYSMKCRVWSDSGDDFKRFFRYKTRNKRVKGEDLEGITLYLGQRSGEGTLCRFYDKLTEQKMKRAELPENLTSWTRCEFEFKGANAMAFMNAFIDYDDKAFSDYVCGVALNHVRFVERTSDNVTRCQTKRWWKAFLNGCTKAVRLVKVKPQRSAVARAFRWIDNQVLGTIYTLIECLSVDGFMQLVQDKVCEKLDKGKELYREDIAQDIAQERYIYEDMSAFKQWDYRSNVPSEEFQEEIKSQQNRLVLKLWHSWDDLEQDMIDIYGEGVIA